MPSCLLGVAAVLLAVAPSPLQEQPPLPKVAPPEMVFTWAFEWGGAVKLRFFIPVPSTRAVQQEVERGGKKEVDTIYPLQWHLVDLEVDCTQVRAFDVEGKPIARRGSPGGWPSPRQLCCSRSSRTRCPIPITCAC